VFRPTGPGANRRAKFLIPSLWAKLLEEIRLGHSSAERRPEIVDVKNQVCHKRLTGLGPAPPTAVTEPSVRELCVFDRGGR
jgi:hypothetical protein